MVGAYHVIVSNRYLKSIIFMDKIHNAHLSRMLLLQRILIPDMIFIHKL